MEKDLLLKLVIGAMGGIARSIFHYFKKVQENEGVKFDIGKMLFSVLRAAAGAAIVTSSRATTNPIMLLTAGLTADVIGKDFWGYIKRYFKEKNVKTGAVVLLLAGSLAFAGAGTAQAAPEFHFGSDFNNQLYTRASLPYKAPQLNREVNFFLEAPLEKRQWGSGTDKEWRLTGMNLGVRGKAAGPFYGLVQLNTNRMDDWGISGFETGLGFRMPFVVGSHLAAELTVCNPRVTNFSSFVPDVTVLFGYSFDIFPTTPEGNV